MTEDKDKLPTTASSEEVASFLRKVASAPRPTVTGERTGRLMFAMDATASREPTWDRAANIQAEMFTVARDLGGLAVQLVYYRGFMEFEASPWLAKGDDLLKQMTRVTCAAGQTQIGRVLRHAIHENSRRHVDALVFVGDCVEEDPAGLATLAGQLGILGTPAFVFQEGRDPVAEHSFQQIAGLTRGAYCRFDAGSAQQLKDLLSAVAAYAAGGRKALQDLAERRGGLALRLTNQMGKG